MNVNRERCKGQESSQDLSAGNHHEVSDGGRKEFHKRRHAVSREGEISRDGLNVAAQEKEKLRRGGSAKVERHTRKNITGRKLLLSTLRREGVEEGKGARLASRREAWSANCRKETASSIPRRLIKRT